MARNGNGLTVGQVADKYPNDRVIMRINGHLTCAVKNSIVKDIWDCREEICDIYWIVE